MLKKSITYKNFNGREVVKDFYFHLSASELVEMEVSTKEGLGETLKRIIKTEDHASLIKEFKTIILASYGERSEDGERFIKNDALRDEFMQTAAYDALFMELAMSDGAAAEFVTGLLPADLSTQLEAQSTAKSPTPEQMIKTAQDAVAKLPPPARATAEAMITPGANTPIPGHSEQG